MLERSARFLVAIRRGQNHSEMVVLLCEQITLLFRRQAKGFPNVTLRLRMAALFLSRAG